MKIRGFAFDADKTIKGKFKPSASAERAFYRQLKKVAQVSGHIVDTHTHGKLNFNTEELIAELNKYAKKLEPWARTQAAKMLQQVQNSNKRAYQIKSKAIGAALKLHVAEAPVGEAAILLLNEQVGLITSIPKEAGLRAQKIASEAFLTGKRFETDEETVRYLEEQMGFSTDAAIARATLIARTETARANAAFNEARAVAVGSGQYRWHNSGDEAVRPSHETYKRKPLQGRIFSWDEPPTLSDGMTGHPGTFPNCRCFAEPVFDVE